MDKCLQIIFVPYFSVTSICKKIKKALLPAASVNKYNEQLLLINYVVWLWTHAKTENLKRLKVFNYFSVVRLPWMLIYTMWLKVCGHRIITPICCYSTVSTLLARMYLYAVALRFPFTLTEGVNFFYKYFSAQSKGHNYLCGWSWVVCTEPCP